MTDNDKDGKSGSQEGQGDKTADKSGDNKQKSDEFTPEQQEKINSLLAEERRKEAKKAAKLQTELETLKTKGLPKDEQTDARIKQMEDKLKGYEDKLKGYEAKELANDIAADLKIPKEEREKFIRHVTATDEDGIREQLKRLKSDFAPSRTGTGSNPARQAKPGKNDRINQFIRSGGRI